jgi:hypothetical protein
LPTFTPSGGKLPLVPVTITPPSGFPVNFPAGNAFVFYTTDGTLPTHASPAYTGPIQIDAVEAIHAIAYYPGVCTDSMVAVANFRASQGTGSGSSSWRLGLQQLRVEQPCRRRWLPPWRHAVLGCLDGADLQHERAVGHTMAMR